MTSRPRAAPEAAARPDNTHTALGDLHDAGHHGQLGPDNNSRHAYNAPGEWRQLDELAVAGSIDESDHDPVHKHTSLEETHSQNVSSGRDARKLPAAGDVGTRAAQGNPQPPMAMEEGRERERRTSRLATQTYTISYLVFFSLLGTLARLGLTALTQFPGSPVIFGTVWANFAGSLIMGFLAEDRAIFLHHDKSEPGSASDEDLLTAKKAHLAVKKTIPLYIGLATGFCGSFTSFSSFIRDIFLAMSDDLETPGMPNAGSRSGGDSFMALVAVVITSVTLSLGGLFLGAHSATALGRFTPSLPRSAMRLLLDPLCIVLAWGCWLGAVFLSVFPPHENWRGRATFSLVFAPLGCLLRFYLSVYLNGRIASFPLGTFAANVAGTAVLGMAWDIAHVPVGGVIGCQVLQGVEDGFCGCLTTISTWVAELSTLRRRHAYTYGSISVLVSFALLVVIMGGLRWTDGFSPLQCG
ncbi:hypothetical protein HIM_07216 [Hirsutella minnesotensis 3608]|uniref:Fluoride export protein 1 n=1 Tax=Hirsutella minnesotensis 3608 TaxID=1043627 RepID=A0A0F7ZZ13_9HYPO|nr:hypothetical protein HIM_07216 [Hirsutella minnesotensis 3608]